MKIVEINSVFNGSTGKIMTSLAEVAHENGIESYCCANGTPSLSVNGTYNVFRIGNSYSRKIHAICSYIDGYPEKHSSIATNKLIHFINKVQPDLIHIHNLHGFFVNSEKLFSYFKEKSIAVVWTLHDCWSFTGRCPYFDLLKCDSWRTGCIDCKYPKEWYPRAIKDISNRMWLKKREWFTGVDNLTIVTPSKWLAGLVKESYLKEYPVRVINNGINLDVFKPTYSHFRKIYHCENKKILLGVAFDWGRRKGLDVINELADRLPTNYQIVIVGSNDGLDKEIDNRIISIHRTHNQKELAGIYTAADLFINPTREDNYPTVNMESIACGTRVVTFNTGGSPEMINSEVGAVVECDDINAFEEAIKGFSDKTVVSQNDCLSHARSFNMHDRFQEYIELYKNVLA